MNYVADLKSTDTVLSRSVRLPLSAVLLGILLFSAGCTEPAEQAESNSNEVPVGTTESSQCSDALATAVARALPENFMPHTAPRQIVNGLNSWLSRCGQQELESVKLSEATQQLLSPSALRYVTAARFTVADAVYIRDALLLNALTQSVWERADAASDRKVATDQERVSLLFAEVIRTISLMNDDEVRVPIGLYEVLLTGRGTANDRAWAMGEALRQRKIDGILLLTEAAPVADNSNPLDSAAGLVAVVLEEGVLLCDPQGGTLVDIAPDQAMNQLNQHDRWKDCSVRIIAQPGAFSPRTWILEQNLLADYAAVLFEELAGGTTSVRPLTERISAVTASPNGTRSLQVWDYPEQQVDMSSSLTEEQRRDYTMLLRPFDAPFERDPLKHTSLPLPPGVDPESLSDEEKLALKLETLRLRTESLAESADEMFGRESRRLLTTRVQQLTGASAEQLIPSFQQVAIGSRQESISIEILNEFSQQETRTFPLPELIRQVHQSAVGNALYWTAMSQLAQGNDGIAIAAFRSYRRQFPAGVWTYPSLMHESIALHNQRQIDAAIAALKEADVAENPERVRVQRMLAELAAGNTDGASGETPPAETPPA
ncbi:MAG: hypothetical protein KDA85_14870, partial [Planctomycetaceae bacterium]|nr:hypothetical protein [Planctomycetaceae bacterium]